MTGLFVLLLGIGARPSSEAQRRIGRRRSASAVAESVPGLGLVGDIALDPYTSHGHDGIFREGEVLNDETDGE